MKVRLTFKTPDVLDNAVDEYTSDIDDDEMYIDIRSEIREVADKFIKYGEVVTIELDIENVTAVVVPVKG